MKKFLLALLFAGWVCNIIAQEYYPPEWKIYASGGYLFDVQSDSNRNNQSETLLKNELLEVARTNVAKQIKLQVQNRAQMKMTSVDGHSHHSFDSKTELETSSVLRFVKTLTDYDIGQKRAYAMAYINKEEVRQFWFNELAMLNNKIETAISVAGMYLQVGENTLARSELQKARLYFPALEEPLEWLNVFGISQSDLQQWIEKIRYCEQAISQIEAEQLYDVCICLKCEADLFSSPYAALEKELKGLLAGDGCRFSEESDGADWLISVRCSARESTCVVYDKTNIYLAYVDAAVRVEKGGMKQCVLEDVISEKGGSMFSYHAAAEAAYKQIKKRLSERLKQTIGI